MPLLGSSQSWGQSADCGSPQGNLNNSPEMRQTTSNRYGLRRCAAGSVLLALMSAMLTTPSLAQQVVLPSGDLNPVQPGISAGPVDVPQTNLAPVPSASAPAFGSSPVGPVPFDPYAAQPGMSPSVGAAPAFPSSGGEFGTAIGPPVAVPAAPSDAIRPSPPGSSLFSRIFSRPAGYPTYPAPSYGAPPPQTFGSPAPTYGAPLPNYGVPVQEQPPLPPLYQAPAPTIDNPSVYGPPAGYGAPQGAYPSSAYPAPVPSTLFPNGISSGGFVTPAPIVAAGRFLQGPRVRHTFVGASDSATSLQTHDFDFSLVFAFQNFLYSTQPLYVVPSFSLHLWDGPAVGPGGADLPPNAYSAFMDVGWESNANKMVGTELGIRFGMFSDFNSNNSESFRILGKGLVAFRCSPQWTLKGGVYYLDRNSVKLVPAGGFLWQPSPFTRVDLFFPQPRFARYCRTIGTRDVWWYFSGDYGGGSWTVRRDNGTRDSVDINELRAILGIEWGMPDAIRAGRRSGFAEIGYAFNREIKYRYNPDDDIKPGDGIMFRMGFGY